MTTTTHQSGSTGHQQAPTERAVDLDRNRGADVEIDRDTNRYRAIEMDMDKVGAFAGQIAGLVTGGVTSALIVVGDRLGLYAALAEAGPVTPEGLAERTGTSARYLREWLAQQAATGIVSHDAGTFTLSAEHAAVLASDDSPVAMSSAALLVTALHRRTDEVARAFRSGSGISWGDQDPSIFEHVERFFQVSYRNSLVSEWIPSLNGVQEKLENGCYVADIGCGHGAPLLLLAEAFPESRFVGFDSHEPSVLTARQRAVAAGVADRVSFEVSFCQGYPQDGYDLITFFDAFHDLGDPTAAAAYAKAALAGDGTLTLIEPRSGDDLDSTIATNPAAALGLAASTFVCIPNSLSQPGAAALGGQAGERQLTQILTGVGFSGVRRAAENDFNMVLEARP